MKKHLAILGILFISLTSLVFAQDAALQPQETATKNTTTIHVKRGQALSYNEIAAIAEIKTARDEKGQPAQLDTEKTYTIASFTNVTVTIFPPSGSNSDVITLDLKSPKGEANTKLILNDNVNNK